MRIGEHDTHPAADTLPLMDTFGLAGLTDDIATNGLREGFEIVLLCDMEPGGTNHLILDGRNRYRACLAAKVEPRFTYYVGDDSDEAIVQYIVSVNLARRNLDDGQRALVVRRLTKLIRGERKRNRQQPALPGVSAEADGMADRVIADGCPELVAAVDRGDIPLHVAAAVSQREPDEQRALVDKAAKDAAVDAAPPKRAKSVDDAVVSEAIRLTPVDVVALRAMVFLADKSMHAEVRAGGDVVRRMCPAIAKKERQ